MKLFLNSFCILVFIISFSANGDEFFNVYNIKVSNVSIGKLEWNLFINDKKYQNNLKLYSKGLLSTIYKFEGGYNSEGVIKKNKIISRKYSHKWKTKKNTKTMSLVFEDKKILSIEQFPIEKEKLKVDVFNFKEAKDPLSSFLQILMGGKKALVVDGRRTYTMEVINTNNTITINLTNYLNLWTDHKKNKFEKIKFIKKNKYLLPFEIHIYFDGRIFKLEKI